MIIGIDGNEANVEHKVGVSVYASKLLQYFQKQADKDTQFRIYLRKKPGLDLPSETPYFQYRTVFGPTLWLRLFLPLYLNIRRESDVFFAPAHYSPPSLPVPLVVTIHDLAYYYYPDEFLKKDLFKLTNWTKESVEKAKKIIAVSKTTKKDIMKFYAMPDNKINVIYNGFEKNSSNNVKEVWETLANRYALQQSKYILYLGTLQPRKDIPTLIEAFNQFHNTHQDMKLVIVGKKGWMYDEIIKGISENQANIIFTGYLPDAEASALYQHAFCFVLPSLYEGFGIPILEAMSYGCPVVTSYAASLPEVGGEACLYFEPKSSQDLLFNLNLLFNDKKLQKELKNKGFERITEFSWEKCAEETLTQLKAMVK